MSHEVFIGYDQREFRAAKVCEYSILKRNPDMNVRFLDVAKEPVKSLYKRTYTMDEGQKIDDIDGKPFSTDFSFSRFLIPHLMKYKGWALFCDCDFLFLDDIGKLFDLRKEEFAVMCVKHNQQPENSIKMDNQIQTRYFRKNWSSLVLWNCGHPSNRIITPEMVNTATGGWLHAFSWLKEEEIGALPEEWNWLVSISPTINGVIAEPKGLHYTEGGPWFPNYSDCEYSEEWKNEFCDYVGH